MNDAEPSFDQYILRYRGHLVAQSEPEGWKLPSFAEKLPGDLTPEQAELWRRVHMTSYEEWNDCGDTDTCLWLNDIEHALIQIDQYIGGELGQLVYAVRGSYRSDDLSEGVSVVVVDDSREVWLSGASEHVTVKMIKTSLHNNPIQTGGLEDLQLPRRVDGYYLSNQGGITKLYESETGPRA